MILKLTDLKTFWAWFYLTKADKLPKGEMLLVLGDFSGL